jgi:outer membrane protein OmpA-like peptidoglycan-associated protein
MGDHFRMHLGVGRGITAGYGTSAFRGLVSIRYERTPPPVIQEPDFVVSVLDIPEDLLDEPEPPPPDEPTVVPGEWREGELARVAVDRIEIREPIQFEFATSRILPVSLPLLRQVATLLNRNAGIGHLLIEGHASQEGSFTYNYDLSIRRARAVYEQLIVLGVHPARMSYRGMGKVMPLTDATDEESLAANRRVEFKIIHQYGPGDELPVYAPQIKLPWSGEPAEVEVPRELGTIKPAPGSPIVPVGPKVPSATPQDPLPPPPHVAPTAPTPTQDPR